MQTGPRGMVKNMKISSLYNMITDASDVLDYFEGVDSQDQLISRLERLKHSDIGDLMACIDGLRSSVSEILDESLEVSTILNEIDGEDNTDDELNDAELDNLIREKTSLVPAASLESVATGKLENPMAEKQNPDDQPCPGK